MNIVFTLCSNNYLAQAFTLGNSLLLYNPGYKFIIGLVDRKNRSIDYSAVPYEILEVENIGIHAFEELYLRYNITELSTAVKPFYFRYFFNNSDKSERVIYLDPDILVYTPFTDLEKELDSSDIIITPHFSTPLNDDKLQTEEDFLNTGLYNLGFIAVKNSPEGNKMVEWWAERLHKKAFIDLKRGLFTDQIWINFVPLFFNNVKILNHPGYNMAYWNLHERKLSGNNGRYSVNEKFPLVFYHFSGYNPLIPQTLSKYQDRFTLGELPDLKKLFGEYSENLVINGYLKYIEYPNAFSEIKNRRDIEKRKKEIGKLPFLIRVFRIIVLKVSARYGLFLD